MKVLHIIDSGGLYGAEVMLLNLMEEQRRMGLEPILASIGDPGCGEKPLEAEATRRGLRVERIRMRPGPNMAGAMKVLQFARNEKVYILHSHGYKGNILFGLMPRWIRRIPMVTTLHGWTWTGGWSRMAVYEWLDRLSLHFIDRVVVVSEAMKAKVGIKDIYVINNGIPIDTNDSIDSINNNSATNAINATNSINAINALNAIDAEIVSFCNSGYTIGSIGRISPEKGYDILLKAISEVSESVHEIRLVILGEGGERGYLEAEVKRLGLDDKVLMPGYVANASRFLPLFKVFVLSSLTEGLPMVILEAMRAGVPIIATRVGGIPEVLENGAAGILIDSGNYLALVKKLKEIISNPTTSSQWSQAAKLRVNSLYSSLTMAENYMGIYKIVLQSNSTDSSEPINLSISMNETEQISDIDNAK
jgi:glycosyltransferase involved in cell wall biosynthesis